ncbi:MAG: FISUMP domain-containing protein [Bacteroidota bacterium]
MSNFINLAFSFILYTLPLLSFCQDQIQDERDNKYYNTIQLGNLLWMIENLVYEQKGSVCFNDCNTIRFYDYKKLLDVCPKGWRLPRMEEWDSFTESFTEAQKVRMMEKNEKQYRVDFLDKYNIFKENILDIGPYGRIEGGELVKGQYIDFWTTNSFSKDERFHMHLTPYSITGHGHKHHLKTNKLDEYRMFPVRCVKKVDQ